MVILIENGLNVSYVMSIYHYLWVCDSNKVMLQVILVLKKYIIDSLHNRITVIEPYDNAIPKMDRLLTWI